MEHLEGEQHSQYEGNLRAHRSMRDYRNSPWMNMPSCMVPPTNVPYVNSYKPSWRNHLNLSWGPEHPQYAPPASPSYASTPRSQPPQSTSPMEQAILNLTKLMGDFVEEQKTINAQLSQKIDTMENIVDKRIYGLQSEMEHKLDNLQYSISRLINQHGHQEEGSQEEECLSETMVEEQCQQQLLLESSDIGAVVYPWDKKEAIPLLLIEEAMEEHQENNLPLPPTDSVCILPTPAAQFTPKTPTTKATPSALPVLHNIRKLVATVRAFATTSKTLATANVAWHSRWFGC